MPTVHRNLGANGGAGKSSLTSTTGVLYYVRILSCVVSKMENNVS